MAPIFGMILPRGEPPREFPLSSVVSLDTFVAARGDTNKSSKCSGVISRESGLGASLRHVNEKAFF